LILFLQVIT